MQFPWLFNARPQTHPFSGIFTTLRMSAATVKYLNKHACRPCMHFKIIKTWNHQLPENWLSDTQNLCVYQLVSGNWWFRQIISQNSIIFPWLFKLFQFQWFFHAWNFLFHYFPGFPWFPKPMGTLLDVRAAKACFQSNFRVIYYKIEFNI